MHLKWFSVIVWIRSLLSHTSRKVERKQILRQCFTKFMFAFDNVCPCAATCTCCLSARFEAFLSEGRGGSRSGSVHLSSFTSCLKALPSKRHTGLTDLQRPPTRLCRALRIYIFFTLRIPNVHAGKRHEYDRNHCPFSQAFRVRIFAVKKFLALERFILQHQYKQV